MRLIKNLASRLQSTQVNTSFSSWSELLLAVPKGSALGPLLFNIYLNDLFYLTDCTNVCRYLDGTSFHAYKLGLKIF